MHAHALLLIAGVSLAYGAVSRRLRTTLVSAPMVFVAIGLLASPEGLGVFHGEHSEQGVHLLAELTLVLLLFSDASRMKWRALRAAWNLPVRLLGIGLPLIIALGGALALVVFPELSIWEALLLGSILAPTDAALGEAVVSNESVPARIRQSLNVESGLNDGICVPAVLFFAGRGCEVLGTGEWVRFVSAQLLLAPLVAIPLGLLGTRMLEFAIRRQWMERSYIEIAGVGLAILAFAGAETVGGNGLIAAFVAGLTVGNATRNIEGERLEGFAEAEGQLMTLIVFLLTGAFLLWPVLTQLNGRIVIYVILSLTIVRMAPVAVALLGSKLRPMTVAYMGWFGPRGLASLLFVLLIADGFTIPHLEELTRVVLTTVFASIVLHGATAYPVSEWYARAMSAGPDEMAERRAAPALRMRLG